MMEGLNLKKICRTTTILLSILVATCLSSAVSPDVEVKCGAGDTCMRSYDNIKGHDRCCIYESEGTENINGTLHHGLTFTSDGMCFKPRFNFRGLSDLKYQSWELPKLDTKEDIPGNNANTGKLSIFFMERGTPNFGKINVCQNILAARQMKFTYCDKAKHLNCRKDDRNYCLSDYYASTLNPVKNWLDKKAEDGGYPTVKIANETHISIDWDQAAEFKCGEGIKNIQTDDITHVSGSFTIKRKGSKIQASIQHDHFTFKNDYIAIEDLIALEEPKCYNIPVEIILKLKFPTLLANKNGFKKIPETAISIHNIDPFSPIIQQSLFAAGGDLRENSKIDTENRNKTYLIIRHKDGEAPINCLKKKVIVKDRNTDNRTEVEIVEKRKVDLTPFITTPCEETNLKITVKDNKGNNVIRKLYQVLPTVNADQTNSTSNRLTVNEEKFESCSALKFEVECNSISSNITKTQILSYNSTIKKSDEYVSEGFCRARAFLCDEMSKICNDTSKVKSKWTSFYGQVSPKIDESTVVGSVTGSLVGVVVIAAGVVMFMRFKEKKTRQEEKEKLIKTVKHKDTSSLLPEHVVFQKDENLGNYLIDITNLQAEVIEEFNTLEKYDEDNIKSKETTNTATTALNLSRNRYKDMVPYDSKIVLLNRATGDPPSRYINASIIQFPNWDQKFLAVQAPKPNMFSGLWQLVMEHNVSVIVMITGLIEGGRVKAHQYWPDDNDTVMKLDNGIEVEFLSLDETRSVYHHRQFKVTSLNNKSITVDHLLCVSWEDMTAPKDTKTLRDLVETADLLIDEKPGTMMVHCSAGVGRTGCFIGFYKMIYDNDNDEVGRIDPFQTVVEMRRMRTKMVQKPLQYHYMMKCLSDYVTGETSVYS